MNIKTYLDLMKMSQNLSSAAFVTGPLRLYLPMQSVALHPRQFNRSILHSCSLVVEFMNWIY